MKYFFITILFFANIAHAVWMDGIVDKSTLRISKEYGTVGATCFLVESRQSEEVFVVTNRHVIDGNDHETVDLYNFFNRGDAVRHGSKIFRIPIYSNGKPIWVTPPCGDIAVFRSFMSAEQWRKELGLEILLNSSNLKSIEEVKRTTNRTFYVYGYPLDASGLLMENQKRLQFTNFRQVKLAPQTQDDDCGFVFDGNHKILGTVGGLSGSPVYNSDGIVGVVSGVVVNEFVTTFVPAEYVQDAISIIEGP